MKTESELLLNRSSRAWSHRLARCLINSRFLFIAFLLHVAVAPLITIWVLVDPPPKEEAEIPEGWIVPPPSENKTTEREWQAPPKEPEGSADKQKKQLDQSVPTKPKGSGYSSLITSLDARGIVIPVPPVTGPNPLDDRVITTDEDLPRRVEKDEREHWVNVRDYFNDGTRVGGKPGIKWNPGNPTVLIAEFKCYVGKYRGGDWDCNFGMLADKRWYGNCFYNLMLQIQRWTKGNLKAELKPQPLELADREWLDRVKPPFIFFTGHQDFILEDSEVQNLRDYLMLGGALWIDSSLPGQKSRFDLAVRRELKKVLPGCDFEPLDSKHPLYNSYYHFSGPPAGVNFYKEPVEVIRVGGGGGEVAVLYTLNAYSDLWETGLTEKDVIDTQADWSPELHGYVRRIGPHLADWSWQTGIFYRNINQQSILNAYHFGINIVYYLLTRFQDRFARLPRGSI